MLSLSLATAEGQNMKLISTLLSFCVLSACGAADLSEPEGGAANNQRIDGFGEFTFGMSFEEVLSRRGNNEFNPVSIVECPDVLAVRGCLLTQRADGRHDLIKEGMPYRLAAKLDRNNRLYEIALHYEPEVSLSRIECVEILERTIDWSWPNTDATNDLDLSDDYEWRTSFNGVRYPISRSGQFATVFEPENSEEVSRSYFTSFLSLDREDQCRVSVAFAVSTQQPYLFE